MLGWGILGCGDITERRGAPAINRQPESRLVCVQSRSASNAEACASRHGAARWTSSREALLADPEVQAVYVATEHHRHHADVLAAAEAGKHILCEKPLALSVTQGREMIAACRSNGVALQVAYYRRYYPKLLRMKELLDAGAIGEPVSASIHLSGRIDPGAASPENWRLDAARSGGGALVDTGSHRLDLLCWMLGPAERVAAFAERREMPIEAPDMESLLIRMRNGAHVVTRHGYRTPSDDEWTIVGTEGTLSATPVDGPTLRLIAGGSAAFGAVHPALSAAGSGEERAAEWELPKHENVHYPLFDDFTRRVLEGAGPRYSGDDGLQATRIIEAAYHSARTGRVVELANPPAAR